MSNEIKIPSPPPLGGSWWHYNESILVSAYDVKQSIIEGFLGRGLITASATHNCTQLLKGLSALHWEQLTDRQRRRANGYHNFVSKVLVSKVKQKRAVGAQ